MKTDQKFLRWMSSFLVVSGFLNWNLALASTPSYNAGKYAFLMEACGFYIKSDKLFNTFAKGNALRKEQFNDGYRDIDTESESGGYGHNNSYDCDDALKLTNGLLTTGLSVASNSGANQKQVNNGSKISLSELAEEEIEKRLKLEKRRLEKEKTAEFVRKAKEALVILKLYSGQIDEVFDIKLKTAIRAWQRRNNLVVDGEIHETQVRNIEQQAVSLLEEKERKRLDEERRLAEEKKIKNRDAVAIVIANKMYQGSIPNVDFAENDASAFTEFLMDKLGYRKGNIHLVKDATKAKFELYFGNRDTHKGKLFNLIKARKSDVTIFYSGHGVPGNKDKRGYLLPVDGEPDYPEFTAYPLELLVNNLEKQPAKTMRIFLDTCFSGDSGNGWITNNVSGLSIEIRMPKIPKKIIVVSAAKANEPANWDVEAEQGLFTKHLLLGLNGKADQKRYGGNKDGQVTLEELKMYLDDEMTYQATSMNRRQNADISGNPETVLSTY